ncbi:hypothetical protein [Corynebacterium halotolerans]|uniref:hypothetical protein n=1 Tax=Corynebacterium halotolerans TaxID=225326 RepID=UPI003CE8E3E2
MLTWVFLIIVLILLVIAFTWLFGKLFGRGEILPAATESEDLIGQNRELIAAGELDLIAFDIVPRGYRPEQVDAAIAALKDQLKGQVPDEGIQSIGKND